MTALIVVAYGAAMAGLIALVAAIARRDRAVRLELAARNEAARAAQVTIPARGLDAAGRPGVVLARGRESA